MSNSDSKQRKDYYQTLGVNANSSQSEIDQAYKKLSSEWHPDKHKENRREAERKFHDIGEAYDTLSHRERRSHYDDHAHRQYTDEDADRNFERFYEEHGTTDENERNFIDKHYPNRKRNSYEILGVSRNASADEIKSAYRKLALQYHPKNNESSDARKRFNEINEAYNALSSESKRKSYDNWSSNERAPVKAHNIFDNFWGNRWNEIDESDQFFRPMLTSKWSRDLDRQLRNNFNEDGDIREGESQRSQTYYTNRNGVEQKKVINSRTRYENGVPITETTEEYQFPDGTKEIRKVKDDGKGGQTSNVYHLKKGENLPIKNE